MYYSTSLHVFSNTQNQAPFDFLPVIFLADELHTIDKPVISIVSGYAIVGGEQRSKTMLELSLLLCVYQTAAQENFKSAFTEIDARAPRSTRGIILGMVDGTFPQKALEAEILSAGQEMPALTPEQEQQIIDVGIMYELEEVAVYNRQLLHELNTLTITEGMTLEDAQNVVRKARDMRPWLPWNTQNIAATGPTQPENTQTQ